MDSRLACPKCGRGIIDLHHYDSMILITTDHALITARCPACGTRSSSVQRIPDDMREEVLYAAIEVGAGMGLSD